MSVFDELSSLYASERHLWWEYRGKCAAFAERIMDALTLELGFPRDCVRFVPSAPEAAKEGTIYRAIGVQTFEDDGYCQFVLRLTLYNGNAKTFPRGPGRLALHVKSTADDANIFQVKLYKDAQPFEVNMGVDNPLRRTCTEIERLMRATYEGTLQRYLDTGGQTPPSPIGFDMRNNLPGEREA